MADTERRVKDPLFTAQERITVANASIRALIEMIGEERTVTYLKHTILMIAARPRTEATRLQ